MMIDINVSTYYYGDFISWEAAYQAVERNGFPGGYNSQDILSRCAAAVQQVLNGEAAFERDGVAFAQFEFRKSLVAAMLYAADRMSSKLRILDFGGALGSTYFQNHEVLELFSIKLAYNIVAQDIFVEYGRKHIPQISFYNSIAEVPLPLDMIIISASVNYTDSPYSYLESLLSLNVPYFIVDRTMFNLEEKDRIVLENVPENIYRAIYPCWLLNQQKFLDLFNRYGYHTVFDISDNIDFLPLVEENNTA